MAHGGDARVSYELGNSYAAIRDFTSAAEAYRKACSGTADPACFYNHLAEVLLALAQESWVEGKPHETHRRWEQARANYLQVPDDTRIPDGGSTPSETGGSA